MKPRLVPLYFDPGRDGDFDRQLAALQTLLKEEVEFLPPQPLGSGLPDADGVVLPQLVGEAYRQAEKFKSITLPILLLTTEFGTLSMWDWELATYLRGQGVPTIAPYNIEQARKVCAALGVRRELRSTKFLVFQDNPGQGAQAPIFKRFYWWEDECSQRMFQKFGLAVVHKSFKELGARAKEIPDSEAEEAWKHWPHLTARLQRRPLLSAVKLYLALKRELDADPDIRGMGINCLNESHFSDTTPCLAWSMLYEERKLIWGCEGDTVSMLSKYILHKSLGVPILMTNLYPFLLGNPALKHERIAAFPEVDAEPENHILCGHCGYMGVIPRPMASEWSVRPKVLAIVDPNAHALDAQFPTGDITLAKLGPTMDRLSVAEGTLKGYVQFPGSDCQNGGVIKIKNGRKLMASLVSHHYLLMTGHNLADIGFIANAFGLAVEEVA